MIGPLLGLVPMGVLGAVSVIALEMFEGRTSGLIGLVSGVSAAPVLLVVGAPLADDSQYPLAILASVPIWLLLGFLASRRATRFLAASWRDYWRELFFLTAAVILGAVVALIAAAMLLDESLVL